MLPIRHCKLLALILVAGREQMTHTEIEQNKPKPCVLQRGVSANTIQPQPQRRGRFRQWEI